LTFELASSGNTADLAHLDYSAYSLFSRIVWSSGNGAVLEDTNFINHYHTMLLQSQCSEEFHAGYGKAIGHQGRKGTPLGISIPANNQPIRITIPFLTGLATANRQIPLDTASSLRCTFHIDDFNKFLVRTSATATPDIVISNPRIVANITELSDSTMMLMTEALGQNSYNINYTGIVSTTETRAVGAGTHIANLAFRNSSLNKITLIMQDQALNTNKHFQYNISNRSKGDLQELSYFIAGVRVPQQKMSLVHGVSEVWSENILAERALMDPTHHSSLNYYHTQDDVTVADLGNSATGAVQTAKILEAVNKLRKQVPTNSQNFEGQGAGHTDYSHESLDNFKGDKYGTFFSTVSTETFKSNLDGETIFSGINCLGATTQAELVFGASAPALNMYFFAEVDKILSLDPVTQSWIISD